MTTPATFGDVPQQSDRAELSALALAGVPGALLALLADRGVVPERAALWLFASSYVGLNLMHMAATWSRTYLDRETWRRAPLTLVVVPLSLGVFALTFEAVFGAILLLGFQYYVSIHHGVMQNYGIVRQLQRRNGRRLLNPRLDQAACLLPTAAALVERARRVGIYDDAPISRPPRGLAVALAAAGAVAVALWVMREVRAVRRGERVGPLEPALVLGVHGLWIVLLLGLRSPALPFFAIASGHYVQYLFFVRRFERRAAALSALPSIIARAFAPIRSARYLTGLLALGGLVVVILAALSAVLRAGATYAGLRDATAMAIPPWAAAMLAVNLHHYWVDGRVWRRPAR